MLRRNAAKTLCVRGVLVGVIGLLTLVAMGVSDIQRDHVAKARQVSNIAVK